VAFAMWMIFVVMRGKIGTSRKICMTKTTISVMACDVKVKLTWIASVEYALIGSHSGIIVIFIHVLSILIDNPRKHV
jgi:hypothetical protein